MATRERRRLGLHGTIELAMADQASYRSPAPADIQAALASDPRGFPFRSELSLAPLVAFWEQAFGDHDSVKGAFARMVRAEVEKVPELLRPITDLTVIERHRKLVDVLLAAVFPPASFDQEYAAAMVPFQLRAFYATPPFRRLLMAPDGALRGTMNLAPATVAALRLAFANM
ncbi:MAG: hypothetical protein HYV94_05040, partial [Candidatus Rokubacteria bacterium]|nr:hypothetical protein [Candidatus Rokubacteria bacterium]